MDQDTPLKTQQLVVREPNRAVSTFLSVLMALGVMGFGAFLVWHLAAGALGLHLFVITALIRRFGGRDNGFSKSVERVVGVNARGVRVGDRIIPRSEIADGWYQPRASSRSTVRLVNRSRQVVFEAEVATEAQAVELLRQLGLDASQRRATFDVASPIARSQPLATLSVVTAMVATGLFRAWIPHSPLLPLMLLVALIVVLLYPAKIDVGIDGVLLRWMGTRKFLPLASIRSVEADGLTAIHLQRTDGRAETIETATGKSRNKGGVHREHRDLVLTRIREALDAHRARESGADVAGLVARAGRPVEEWRQALAKLAVADAGYRQAAVREEDLWRVVEDPRADEDARAGAALVLRAKLDDEGKARVRIAAEASASPKLRIALEAASDGTDEAALEALESVGEAVSPRRGAASGDR